MHRKRRLPFRYLEPAFFAGLLDDPILFLRILPLRRAILFDCGQIAHLAKRVVKAIDAVFITHAHMDHIMGIPTLVRHHHASPRQLDVFGPPGIAERVQHLLLGYEWNLCEPTWFTLRVHEIRPEKILHYSFIGPQAFEGRFDGEDPRCGQKIWSCQFVNVSAELFDHKIPVLAFRIQERPCFAVDPRLMQINRLLPGDWIRDLKSRIWKSKRTSSIVVLRNSGNGVREETIDDPDQLYNSVRADLPCSSIGYLCDIGWTEENIAKAKNLLDKVTLLCSDCSFLAADLEKARRSYHLSTLDLNDLTDRLAPRYLLPMHLSKGYLYRTFDLYRELHPPPGTTVLRLPNHIVPAPLTVQDVDGWLRSPDTEAELPGDRNGENEV